MSSSLRLTNRGRLLLGASGLVVALSLLSANTALGNGNGEQAVPAQQGGYDRVTVFPGETLWSIASQIAPEFSSTTGDMVAMIIDINNLDSSQLRAGQELLVPDRATRG
jgi:Tfp pilus assembly protein FimV